MTDSTPAVAPVPTTISLDQIPKGFLYRFDAWGKPFWNVMHSITFSYPDKPSDDDKDRIRIFFKIVPYFLPCSVCGMHFVKEMAAKPLSDEVLASMDTLSRWLVDLHNSVNVRLKKTEVSYEAAKKFYFEDAGAEPREANTVKPVNASINPMYKTAFWSTAVILILLIIVVVALVIVPKCREIK
jgi:hypothetical protein